MILDSYQRERIGTLRPIMQWIDRQTAREKAKRDAAARTGFGYKTIETLYRNWLRQGDDALIDRRKLPRGRKSAADALQLTDAEVGKIRQLALRCDSFQVAIEAFADLPDTRPELVELINRHRARRNYPKALRRAAQVTHEERDLARGNKRFSLHVSTQLRKNTWIDAAGDEHELTAGDLFECDDVSINQPFWYEWPYGGDPLSDMFGVRLGRQVLACIDTASAKWLGYDLIGRVRDAYRAEDVVRFLGWIGSTHGLPRLGFRLEQGVWAARSVRGVKGECTDEGERETFGSVRDVVPIHYVHSPKAKGIIEGSFNLLQTILALSGIQIGRTRGEYEKTTAMMLKCASGRMHPADAGFSHISDMAAKLDAAMDFANNRPKMGRLVQGVPQQKWEADLSESPLSLISDEQAHLFLPVKVVRPIDGTFIRYKVPHYGYTFSFRIPDRLAHLGRGYRLLLCFDPSEPTLGARVFDAETDTRIHYTSTKGQSYGVIEFAPDAPQLDLSGSRKGTHRREYSAAVRSHFRATGMRQGTGASMDQVSNGNGESRRIARGAEIASPHNLPADDTRAAAALQSRRNHVEASARDTGRKYSGLSSNQLLDEDETDEAPRHSLSSEALL